MALKVGQKIHIMRFKRDANILQGGKRFSIKKGKQVVVEHRMRLFSFVRDFDGMEAFISNAKFLEPVCTMVVKSIRK